MNSPVRNTSLALGVLALASCATEYGGARDTFVHDQSCPADRVTVVPLPDYRRPLPPPPSPPPDVASDPERLATWQKQREAERAQAARPIGADGNVCDVFQVTGCGQQRLLCCDHVSNPVPGRSSVGMPVSCGYTDQPAGP